jgi:surfeit locus 1 family protein
VQAEAAGLPDDTPMVQVLVDEVTRSKGEQPSTPDTVYPLPKPITNVVKFSTMPIGHFNYAVGWSCMSAAMAYLAAKVLRGKKGGRR